MTGYKRQARSDQSSIKYRSNPVEGASLEFADFVGKECAPSLSDDGKQIHKKSEIKCPVMMSTTELVTAVGQIWDCANRLSIFHPKANLTDSHSGCKREVLDTLYEENGCTPLSTDRKYFSVDVSSAGQFSPMVQPGLEFLKVTQKMSVFESCSKKYTHSTLWRFLQSGTSLTDDIGGEGLASVGISYDLGSICRWMTETVPAGVRYTGSIPEFEKRAAGEHYIPEDTTGCAGALVSGDTHIPATTKDTDSSSGLIKSKNPSSRVNAELMTNTETTRSLVLDYFLKDVSDMKEDCNVIQQPCSSLYTNYHIDSLVSSAGTYEKCQHLKDDDVLLENKGKRTEKYLVKDEKRREFHSPKDEKPHFAHAKQEHAFAGALAGIFVSLCLHPVDTIKTVIQSCRAEQKSICYIGRSIVSERGLTGLYRGIASNITSSAPISAVYTFTYESVKGALLPHFAKEFHSLAHCMAGGCASVATSFIFTPSERIKQQMQVGSHYHNCWNALVGIIKKGGLPSLYAGWGAVLCRNVPHSIIKFYTYESLKQMMLPSPHPTAQPNTVQTVCLSLDFKSYANSAPLAIDQSILFSASSKKPYGGSANLLLQLVCGAVAGSTAALFTTPFDVVKTRLQTQIPGSTSQYNSVYHALQEIGKNEGLKGLYRGLIPRLVMYMSQGALFFASYEYFKRVFSLEVPQLNAQRIPLNQNDDDNAGSSKSPYPSSASAAALSPSQPTLHGLHS